MILDALTVFGCSVAMGLGQVLVWVCFLHLTHRGPGRVRKERR